MVRQDKSRQGRVTPKGTRPEAVSPASGVSREPVRIDGGGRMPALVSVLMFGLMGLGLLVILANYIVEGLGAPSNWYLLAGLGLILGGIVAATQYR
ncbi:MAG: cell division protein CrgA [Acidimicrobiales bacterium]